MEDRFQTEVTATTPHSIAVWDAAMADYLGFRGTPVEDIERIEDQAFVFGPVFCAAMKILSGVDPNGPSVTKNLTAMRIAAEGATAQERMHVAAIEHMARGNFSAAARIWDDILAEHPNDILAHKCAHEVWFFIGETQAMRASSQAALDRLTPEDAPYAVAAAQHGFALEETGDYTGAEHWGRRALEMVPSDCWALHCLAHVFETQNRHGEAMALLEMKKPHWQEQNLLNGHIWWHLALRLIEAEAFDKALALFDQNLRDTEAGNRFRLTDGTSLLWRLELEGVDVGDRWTAMAEKWAQNATVHTSAFLDLHAALAFSRCPDAPAAALYFESLQNSFDTADSETAEIYRTVVKPLVQAFACYAKDPARAAGEIEALLPNLYRIGGSVVQRELIERSYSSALLATGQAVRAEAWLTPKIEGRPDAAWLLRAAARAAGAQGDTVRQTRLHRRADLMFADSQRG